MIHTPMDNTHKRGVYIPDAVLQLCNENMLKLKFEYLLMFDVQHVLQMNIRINAINRWLHSWHWSGLPCIREKKSENFFKCQGKSVEAKCQGKVKLDLQSCNVSFSSWFFFSFLCSWNNAINQWNVWRVAVPLSKVKARHWQSKSVNYVLYDYELYFFITLG